ncbi:MAG: hypothetical protein HC852_19935 [Acaryochloridaceae cyanobacterium RU_4_10]|nr:hypothetical protein [Acaryochloridaceae cyanobacterium RU_4_10]
MFSFPEREYYTVQGMKFGEPRCDDDWKSDRLTPANPKQGSGSAGGFVMITGGWL